jgi:hypothetical protein
MFTSGVSRKNNRDDTAREFINVKVWFKNSLRLSEGQRTGRGVSEQRNRLWRKTTHQVEACIKRNGFILFQEVVSYL